MDSQVETFYIIIRNRHYRREYDKNDYHLEKIFQKNQVEKIISDEVNRSLEVRDVLITTNDPDFLCKYIITINVEELKMLCRDKSYNPLLIRINEKYFPRLDEDIWEKFQRICNNEIISASMDWFHETVYPYDDESIGISHENYEGWTENQEFEYFITPMRYRKSPSSEDIFYLPKLGKVNLDALNRRMNTNILEIGQSANENLNWELRNKQLRYYDKISYARFYISQQLLEKLREDNNIELVTETRLDKNQYIEHYITRVYVEDEYEDFVDDRRYDDDRPSYSKYNGAHGFDDNTIDSAFEGDPDNCWNVD